MIPLNKPKVYYHFPIAKLNSIEDILTSIFGSVNFELVFSARQGLDLIYKEIYKKKGSCKVAVSPLTCFEALYPILNNHHSIHFVDINPETFNMDEDLIPSDVDVIQPIYFGGNPQNMDLVLKMAKKNSAIIVEDCAQAFGSTYNNLPLGRFGEYSAFSLGKNLYTLAGGLIISREKMVVPDYHKANLKMTLYKKLKRTLEMKNSFNSQLNQFLLIRLLKLKPESTSFVFSRYTVNKTIIKSITNQLNHHRDLIGGRIEVAKKLICKINNKNFVEQKIIRNGRSNYTRLFYRLKEGDCRDYINKLREEGIWANHLSQSTLSNYQQSVFNIDVFEEYANKAKLSNYQLLHNKIISIPVSPALKKEEINHIANTINRLS